MTSSLSSVGISLGGRGVIKQYEIVDKSWICDLVMSFLMLTLLLTSWVFQDNSESLWATIS